MEGKGWLLELRQPFALHLRKQREMKLVLTAVSVLYSVWDTGYSPWSGAFLPASRKSPQTRSEMCFLNNSTL